MPGENYKKTTNNNLATESNPTHQANSQWAGEVDYDADHDYLEEIFKCIVFSGCDMPE